MRRRRAPPGIIRKELFPAVPICARTVSALTIPERGMHMNIF